MGIFSKKDEKEDEGLPKNLPERSEGKIYHLDKDAGWGFISSHDFQFTRIFFHWTALAGDTKNFKDLERGDKVEFTPTEWTDPEDGSKKIRAVRIKVI